MSAYDEAYHGTSSDVEGITEEEEEEGESDDETPRISPSPEYEEQNNHVSRRGGG
jgi:hypothetical protein